MSTASMHRSLRTRVAVAVVVAALVLAGCSPAPAAGVIREKDHTPESTSTFFVKSGSVFIPLTTTSPASWMFDLYDGDEHGWISVDETTYDEYDVGDRYVRRTE